MQKRNKMLILANMILSLCAVGVAAISTFAWFQINTQAPEATIQTKDPNLSINNSDVTGYKVVPTIGTDGFFDKTSNTVTSKKGESYDTSNNHQASEDTNFDVPADGLGYYLVKKNPGDSYKYKYNGNAYSWKFAEFNNGSVNYLKINASTVGRINSTDRFIVREYSYNSNDYKTINQKVAVVEDTGGISVDTTTYEITPPSTGDFNIWFNSSTKKISFEESFSLPDKNLPSRAKLKGSSRAATTKTKDVVIRIAAWSGWGTLDQFGLIALENTTELVAKPTSGQWGAPFLTNMTKSGDYYYIHVYYTSSITECRFVFRQQQDNQTYVNVSESLSLPSGYKNGDILTIGSVNWVSNSSNYNYDGYSYNKLVSATVTKTSSTNNGSARTYYLYDPDGTLGNSPCAYAYYTSTYTYSNGAWHGQQMTYVRSHFYSIALTTTYTKIVFNNGLNDTGKTSDLTLNTTGSNVAYNYKTGQWYNPDLSDSTRTYYLYDPYSKLESFNSSIPYAYLWDSTSQYTSTPNASYPGITMSIASTTRPGTAISSRLWQITTSSTFDSIIFNDGRSSASYKTIDITGITSNHNNAIYVLTGGSGTSISGEWYLDLPSESTYTFYYFDNGSRGTTWTTPGVYAWSSSNISNSTYTTTNGIKNLYKAENQEWSSGGVAMSNITIEEATSLNVSSSYVWKAVVSQSYDKIIFTNGSSTGGLNQTIDLNDISSHNGEFFVITGTYDGKVTGEWHASIYSVQFYATFWVNGTTQLEFDSLTAHYFNGIDLSPNFTDFTFGVEKFSVSSNVANNVPSTITKGDATNGIIYCFDRVGTSFYTDEACSSAFVNNNTLPVTNGVAKLYVKYNVSSSDYVSIYVDDTAWNNENLAVKSSGNDSTYFTATSGSNWKVATGLYRITLRNDWIIQLSSGSHTDYSLGNNGGGLPNMGSGTTAYYRRNTTQDHEVTYTYLKIGGTGAGTSWTWVDFKSTSATGVWVQKKTGNNWDNVEGGQLLRGDGTRNKYIFESGLRLSSEDVIRVKDGDTIYGYSQYVDVNKNKHPYVATGDNGDGITLQHFSNTARFNFYITSDDNISIAMVPDYGNGYYIVPYNESIYSSAAVTAADGDLSKLTQHYCGAVKMDSNDYSAIYSGYYTAGGNSNRIFIRSYLDAVDTLATTLTTSSSEYARIDNGVITFLKPNRYNIQVTNTTIDVSPYKVSDFFKLNPVDTSDENASTSGAIWNQKTSLIMEIPFTCNNPYASAITLTTDCSVSYIGVGLYVTNTRIGNEATRAYDIYTTLRGTNSPSSFYEGIEAADSSSISNSNTSFTSIPANSSSTYYAYILIDYMPGVTQTNILESPGSFKMYLQSHQP